MMSDSSGTLSEAECSMTLLFSETVLLGLPEDVPLDVRQRLWIQHDILQWSNATYPGSWFGYRRLTTWPPWSLDLTPLYFFLWGHLKEHVYADPLKATKDLTAGFQVVMTMADANISRTVQVNAMWCTAICLEMGGDRSEYLL
jgi:hypothetical protein